MLNAECRIKKEMKLMRSGGDFSGMLFLMAKRLNDYVTTCYSSDKLPRIEKTGSVGSYRALFLNVSEK